MDIQICEIEIFFFLNKSNFFFFYKKVTQQKHTFQILYKL